MRKRFAGVVPEQPRRKRRSTGQESNGGSIAMSQFNGDKARFNRERKQNIQRRKRSKALFLAAASSPSPEAGKKPRSVPDVSKDRE